jgi:peptide/nickel transport system substrate-binding protein
VLQGTTNSELVLSMNNDRAPFNDVRVRQAVNYAIDRKALLDTAWDGRGTLIGSMVVPTDPFYEDLTHLYPHDVAKAKQLLAAAGQPNPTIEFDVPNRPYATAAAQAIKSQLADAGITANVNVLEFPARWLDKVFNHADYQMSIISHVEANDIRLFGNPNQYFRYKNPEVTRLQQEADQGSAETYVADMKQSARIVAQDGAAGFLFAFPNLVVAASGVHGLPVNQVTEALDLTQVTRS